MLNPKHQRYADRLQELIEEGHSVARPERHSGFGLSISAKDQIQTQSWLMKVNNMLNNVFGTTSTHVKQFEDVLPQGGFRYVKSSSDVFLIVGLLKGALNDLENGFFTGAGVSNIR